MRPLVVTAVSANDFPPSEGFEQMWNFRPLSQLTPEVQLYRSASTSNATPSDVKHIVETLGIRTLLDMRSWWEPSLKYRPCLLDETFIPPAKGQKPPTDAGQRVKYSTHIGMSGLQFSSAPVGVKVKIVLWAEAALLCYLFCLKRRGLWCELQCVRNLLGSSQLHDVYIGILRKKQKALLECLQLCAEPSNRPMLFNCTSGKDRTGLLATLLLGALGASRNEMIMEYTRSHAWMQSATHAEVASSAEVDAVYPLSPQNTPNFFGAPTEAIERTLDWIDANHGSIEGYLDAIGFDAACRAKLRVTKE